MTNKTDYALSDYEPGQWWLKELVRAMCGESDPDTKRAAATAIKFAEAVFADRAARTVAAGKSIDTAELRKLLPPFGPDYLHNILPMLIAHIDSLLAARTVADAPVEGWDYAVMGLSNEEVAEMWRAVGHSGAVPYSFANRIQERMQTVAAPVGQAEPKLTTLDEIACDLPYLFGRASAEGHETGQALAKEVQAKLRAATPPAQATAAQTNPLQADCKWIGGNCGCTRAQAQRCELIDSRMPKATAAPTDLSATIMRDFAIKVGHEIASWMDSNDPLPDVERIVDSMMPAIASQPSAVPQAASDGRVSAKQWKSLYEAALQVIEASQQSEARAIRLAAAVPQAVELDQKLINHLQACVDDPMWADHAEISKAALRQAIAALTKET